MLSGPYTDNFREAYDAIFAGQGTGRVASADELEALAAKLLNDPAQRAHWVKPQNMPCSRSAVRWNARGWPSKRCCNPMRAPEFWSRPSFASAALAPVGWIYGAVTDWKRTHASPHRARAKVVCVGNLTAGGSGKTPVVEAIARNLKARGLRVMILSRGYGGRLAGPVLVNRDTHSAADVGDEPLLLADHRTGHRCARPPPGRRSSPTPKAPMSS